MIFAVAAAGVQSLPDRGRPRERAIGEPRAHDHAVRRGGVVARVEQRAPRAAEFRRRESSRPRRRAARRRRRRASCAPAARSSASCPTDDTGRSPAASRSPPAARHAGNRLELASRIARRSAARRGVVARRRQVQLEGSTPSVFTPRSTSRSASKAGEEQSRADEQHERERDLRRHEPIAKPQLPRRRRWTSGPRSRSTSPGSVRAARSAGASPKTSAHERW